MAVLLYYQKTELAPFDKKFVSLRIVSILKSGANAEKHCILMKCLIKDNLGPQIIVRN